MLPCLHVECDDHTSLALSGITGCRRPRRLLPVDVKRISRVNDSRDVARKFEQKRWYPDALEIANEPFSTPADR